MGKHNQHCCINCCSEIVQWVGLRLGRWHERMGKLEKHYDHCPIAAGEDGSLAGSRLGRCKVLGKRGSIIITVMLG